MKQINRALCVLLTLLLIFPATLTAVNAQEGVELKDSVAELAWHAHPFYTETKAISTEVVSNAALGGEGNHALSVRTEKWNRYAFELVPAHQMTGVTKYTVEMDIQYSRAERLGFLLNSTTTRNSGGDWACILGDTGLENCYYDPNGVQGDNTNKGSFEKPSEVVHLLAEVDLKSKGSTVTVSLLKNGEVLLDTYGLDRMTAERITASQAASAVYLLIFEAEAVIDNIKVTDTAQGKVIYSEDFESFGKAPVSYIGSQKTAVENGTYNVRFLAVLGDTLESTDYKRVGLRITCGERTWDTPCKTVYESVTAGGNVGELQTVTAESYGARYIMAYTVRHVPTEAGKLTFHITPYFETDAGVTYGTSYDVAYEAGEFVGSTAVYG